MKFSSFPFLPLEFTGQLCHYPSFLAFLCVCGMFQQNNLEEKGFISGLQFQVTVHDGGERCQGHLFFQVET